MIIAQCFESVLYYLGIMISTLLPQCHHSRVHYFDLTPNWWIPWSGSIFMESSWTLYSLCWIFITDVSVTSMFLDLEFIYFPHVKETHGPFIFELFCFFMEFFSPLWLCLSIFCIFSFRVRLFPGCSLWWPHLGNSVFSSDHLVPCFF